LQVQSVAATTRKDRSLIWAFCRRPSLLQCPWERAKPLICGSGPLTEGHTSILAGPRKDRGFGVDYNKIFGRPRAGKELGRLAGLKTGNLWLTTPFKEGSCSKQAVKNEKDQQISFNRHTFRFFGFFGQSCSCYNNL
jgi:hypothetical protein